MSGNRNEKYERDMLRYYIRRALIVAVILIAVILVISFAFKRFKLYSNAHLALREAKNIKISLETVDTEYYALGSNIYDETGNGNIKAGAMAYVKKVQSDPDGIIKLTGYDSKNRKITGFEYELDEYIVRYQIDDNGESWHVYQIKSLLDY